MIEKRTSKIGRLPQMIAATSLLISTQSAWGQNTPAIVAEAPSIVRSVTERQGDRNVSTMMRAHLPVLHTSGDGRIGVDIKTDPDGNDANGDPTPFGNVNFYLFVPEKLQGPFIDSFDPATGSTGVDIVADDPNGPGLQEFIVQMHEFVDQVDDHEILDANGNYVALGEIRHVTIIDKTREFVDPNGEYLNNPVAETIGGVDYDAYYLTAYSNVDWQYRGDNTHPTYRKLRGQFTDIKVLVANPKTANAHIATILFPGDTPAAVPLPYGRALVAGDTVGFPDGDGLTEGRKVGSSYLTDTRRNFENKFTNDGKLMIARVGAPQHRHNYYDPYGNYHSVDFRDIVYAYSSDGSLDGVGNETSLDNPKDGFHNLLPLSWAPYDPRINGKYKFDQDSTTEGEFYGFAAFPFRDSLGTPIPPGAEIDGSYPWMDSDGRTISMSTVSATLDNDDGNGNLISRYPNTLIEGVTAAGDEEDGGPFQNQSMIGLWTQGKLVAMDNSLNNTDYGMGVRDGQHRMVQLYTGNNNGANTEITSSGAIRVGSGRDNIAGNFVPETATGNTTFFDTLENKLNFDENMRPVMPRDVVWWVSNGKSTAQFAFDDYLNPDSFIISNMNGALKWNSLERNNNRFTYYDGWDDSALSFGIEEVRLANDATAVGDAVMEKVGDIASGMATELKARWNIPSYGLMVGADARLEPIAHGGIEGKGVWLEDDFSIVYEIPTQPAGVSFSDNNWYVGLFVDSRVDDTTERRLITFPDGSSVRLTGRQTLRYFDSNDSEVRTIPLPGGVLAWNRNEWRHFAFQISDVGTLVDFYYNGFLYDMASFAVGEGLFQMVENQNITIGASAGSNGYRGWFDEFKVFAQTFDPEVCANLARGTLVGFNADPGNAAVTALQNRANAYRDTVGEDSIGQLLIADHLYNAGQLSHDLEYFAVHYNYQTHDGAHLKNIPVGASEDSIVSIREDILFPEAPLFGDAHRPDSSRNQFCFSCHTDENPFFEMQEAVLDLSGTGVLARDDQRRQPVQALKRVFGHIPADWIGPGLPGVKETTGGDGRLLDDWVLPAVDPLEREVVTFVLVNSGGGIEQRIENSATLVYQTGDAIRANLDAGQGGVNFNILDSNDVEVYSEYVSAAPYSIGVPAGLEGTYNIEATPYDGTVLSNFTVTVSNVLFQASGGTSSGFFEDFESGLVLWTSGGVDATLYTGGDPAVAWPGNAANIQDDNGAASSIHTGRLSLSGVDAITVGFDFLAVGMNVGGSFMLEVSYDDGANYSPVETWVRDSHFTNGLEQTGVSLTINASDYGPFTDLMRLRFRCNGNNDAHDIYLDNIDVAFVVLSGPVLIQEDDFEGLQGDYFGDWTDGGNDARVHTGTNVIGGLASLFIRNFGSEANITTSDLALASYGSLEVEFSFKPAGFEAGESFQLQKSTDGGVSYLPVETWTVGNGSGVENLTVYSVTVPVGGLLNDQTRLRFQSYASELNDRIYLDDVIIRADY